MTVSHTTPAVTAGTPAEHAQAIREAAAILATGQSTPAGILSRNPADPWTRELAAALAAERATVRPPLRLILGGAR